MKISNREKVMLCILGIFIVGFLYYHYLYSPQMLKIQEKMDKKNQIQTEYDEALNTINSLERKESEIKILNAKIKNETEMYYPVISQKHIICELDKLLKDSNLEGGFKFEPIECGEIESLKKENDTLEKSSISKNVKDYRNITNDSLEIEREEENKNFNKDKSKDDEKKEKNTVQYIKCELSFLGSYEALDKFFELLNNYNKKIVVSSIKMEVESVDTMKGKINLEIYAIPKLDDEITDYSIWKQDSIYGKSNPFEISAVAGTAQKLEKDNMDFALAIKSKDSDLPTVTLGKANDNVRNTYVYGDKNEKEDVEIVLTKYNDKYYYKYKTSSESFPKNYNDLGIPFTPLSDNIVLNIFSESRTTSNDKSGVNLTIDNETDKLVKVNIKNDDSSSSRVKIVNNSDNVIIN